MARSLLRLNPALAAGLVLLALVAAAPASGADAPPMPEFRHQDPGAWLNSSPLTREQLRGKVVLVDLFTTS